MFVDVKLIFAKFWISHIRWNVIDTKKYVKYQPGFIDNSFSSFENAPKMSCEAAGKTLMNSFFLFLFEISQNLFYFFGKFLFLFILNSDIKQKYWIRKAEER